MIDPALIKKVFTKATCLYTQEQVEAALDKMAQDITQQLANENPLVLCVMIGAVIPTASLLTRMDFPLELDYIHATRYTGRTSGHDLVWKREPQLDLKNRTVLVVDDILDQGVTLAAIIDYCKQKGAKKVLSAVLVEKELSVRVPNTIDHADFSGIGIGDHYVFGYGMDYKEYLRNAQGIFAIADEHK